MRGHYLTLAVVWTVCLFLSFSQVRPEVVECSKFKRCDHVVRCFDKEGCTLQCTEKGSCQGLWYMIEEHSGPATILLAGEESGLDMRIISKASIVDRKIQIISDAKFAAKNLVLETQNRNDKVSITCTKPSSCVNATILSASGYETSLNCTTPQACNNIAIHCPTGDFGLLSRCHMTCSSSVSGVDVSPAAVCEDINIWNSEGISGVDVTCSDETMCQNLVLHFGEEFDIKCPLYYANSNSWTCHGSLY